MNKSAHNPMEKSRRLTFFHGSGSLDLFTVVDYVKVIYEQCICPLIETRARSRFCILGSSDFNWVSEISEPFNP